MKFVDLTGKQFGKWTVLGKTPKHICKYHNVYWVCRCECGTIKDIFSGSLIKGLSTSCGKCSYTKISIGRTFGDLTVIERDENIIRCQCKCGNVIDIAPKTLISHDRKTCGRCKEISPGDRFGRLVVIRKTEIRSTRGTRKMECLCDCGNTVFVLPSALRAGNNKSCGCLNTENGGHGRGNGGIFNSAKLMKNIRYDSSYEKKCLYLFEYDTSIYSFDRCNHIIEYFFNGCYHKYYPDFIVNDTRIIEVKSKWELMSDKVLTKKDAAHAYCLMHGLTYEIWTERELNIKK